MEDNIQTADALQKALSKVDEQQARMKRVPISDPLRDEQMKVLESLRQSATLARMAEILADDERERR